MIPKQTDRVFCPVCLAKFKASDTWKDGDMVICPVCGQKLKLRLTPDGFMGERPEKGSEKEIRERVEEFARLRGYFFNEIKEDIIVGLMGKYKRFGDFYCPCRMVHEPEYQCPCKPTRSGDVEKDGRCYCGFFWKRI